MIHFFRFNMSADTFDLIMILSSLAMGISVSFILERRNRKDPCQKLSPMDIVFELVVGTAIGLSFYGLFAWFCWGEGHQHDPLIAYLLLGYYGLCQLILAMQRRPEGQTAC